MARPNKPNKKGKNKLGPSQKKLGPGITAKVRSIAKNILLTALPILTIVTGATLIFIASTSSLNLDWKHPFLAEKTPVVDNTGKISRKPATLYIPKLNRVLAVSDGEFVGDRWTISQTGVSYLKTTPAPGSKGNSVLYGHNLSNVLGDMYLLQNGDSVYVVSQNGALVKYQVSEIKEVTPDSVEILNNSKDFRLTLYTCSGFLDTARFVVIAKQVRV